MDGPLLNGLEMRGRRQRRAAWFWVGLCWLGWPGAGSLAADALPAESGSARTAPALAALSDAELCDVVFADRRHAWAVGDRGAVWHSSDAGENWSLVDAGLSCRIESLWFLDPDHGWLGGGVYHPLVEMASGTLAATVDGGRRWTLDPRLPLPPLRQVGFHTRRHGWALGGVSHLFDAGAFATTDGGRSWQPLAGLGGLGWTAGDVLEEGGALAGPGGVLATLRGRNLEPSRTAPLGLRGVHRIRFGDPQHGWLVGDGGLILTSSDLGRSWQAPPTLPDGLPLAQCDWHALAVRGSKCWMAGSPGTRVLHTTDNGQSWHVLATGQALPIRGLAFADDRNGLAVGALGTILRTTDGGATWQTVRRGGRRVALAALFARTADVPLELLARLADNDGYLAQVELVCQPEWMGHAGREPPLARLRQATSAVGAAAADAAWRFPLRQSQAALDAAEIVALWDRANDGRGRVEFIAHLVRHLRTWRPDVVFTHGVSSREADPLAAVVQQCVLEALELAADPTRHGEQIVGLGLEPWRVQKLYGCLGPGHQGDVVLSTAQMATRLGSSLADAAALPRATLERRFTPCAPQWAFRLYVDRTGSDRAGSDFLAGIRHAPGSDARRLLDQPPPDRIEQLRQMAQKRATIDAILEQSAEGLVSAPQLQGQIADLVGGLETVQAGRILCHLAERYYHHGQGELAAETWELLVKRYPEHPLAPAALARLVQYWSSSEMAWRAQAHQRVVNQASLAGGKRLPAEVDTPPGQAIVASAAVQSSGPALDAEALGDRDSRAAQWGAVIESRYPHLYSQPQVRFPLAVADRRRGFPAPAQRYFLGFSPDRIAEPWHAAGVGERWLADPQGIAPKAVARAPRAGAKPQLDGALDELLWQQARPLVLASAARDDASWPAAAWIAYDDEFLYLACRAAKAPGLDYPPAERPRPRDADLATRDRVQWFFDLDRDYASFYRLEVDSRGWTWEACWDDASWNPTWFVASAQDERQWTVEAAIPLEELCGVFPAAGTVWALGVQRVVPRHGLQSWTQPAAADVVPQAFGYLVFE